ncbi:DSD1 family PLP-dependent enzyme [Legionella sp. W05-934-2]|jgi:D-serine deaminase-like pyridoxal phosphate-dependent protein|uniref:DSD1 family PLP-dependent enzyme n=1 Tax=Legionella sp. W05-934-2 TaxID=1198649 RepID=UPI0034635780
MTPDTFIGKHKYELDTPCLIIDIDSLKRNLMIMQNFGKRNNIAIRPHTKTHKCSKLAQLQIDYGAIGVCATKVSEAEVLINHEINKILITSPVVTPTKLKRLSYCIQKSSEVMVVVDNLGNANDLNELGKQLNKPIKVLIDLDSGIGRTGIKNSEAVDFAKQLSHYPFLALSGIQCYAGNLQHIQSYQERKQRSLMVMKQASLILKQLREAGFQCDILTGTGTGTYDIDCQDTLITEIQPGSYTVMDVEYFEIESEHGKKFNTFAHSMTLLSTVISSNRKEHVTVDSGTKGIYVDNHHKPIIVNHEGLIYDWNGFGDEHGKIMATNGGPLPLNGTVLEMIVPHCDPTINLYDHFYMTQNDVVIDVWQIDMRGKAQ